MSTERTPVEAEAYVIESIEYWKANGFEKRIISLSNWAEKWRVSGENTDLASKIKIYESGIRNLQRAINDNKKLDINTDSLQDNLQLMVDSLNDLSSTYYPPANRTRKSNK